MTTNTQYLDQLMASFNTDTIYLQQAFDYYHQQYLGNEWAQQFVADSALISAELKQHSTAGLCDRTLGLKLPKRKTLEGGAIRGSLQRQGLLLPTGGERFRGCIVFPFTDGQGQIISAIGYRYARRIRAWQQEIIRWSKPSIDDYFRSGLSLVDELIYGKALH